MSDSSSENQIVVYQPNETVRLEVRLENETVWLNQSQMATLFGCSTDNIGLHLKNVYSVGELSKEATTEDFSVVRLEGSRQVRRTMTCYNLGYIPRTAVGSVPIVLQDCMRQEWQCGNISM